MTTRHVLMAMTTAALIAGAAGCGTSSTPTASTPTSTAAPSSSQPAPAQDARSACDQLAGTVDADKICHVQADTPGSDTGVHPVTTYKAFNYDVGKHTPVTFDTLFRPGSAPLDVLNPIIQRELDKHGGGNPVFATDIGTDVYQNFAITDDTVNFFFDQDGLLPHTEGPFEVDVPRSELAPLMAGSDAAPPCASGQVRVTAEQPQAAVTHRAVTLTFGLAPGAAPCTVTGYPGVDSGSGGPRLHADRLPRGYMGGLPEGVDVPSTVTLSPSTSAHAVVESPAVDSSGNQCASYSGLRVTPPDTTETSDVATTIDACALVVHPVT